MTERALTTDGIRSDFIQLNEQDHSRVKLADEFDRWLNEIRAEAWDEGRRAEELGWIHAWDGHPVPEGDICDECKVDNPYRPNEK